MNRCKIAIGLLLLLIPNIAYSDQKPVNIIIEPSKPQSDSRPRSPLHIDVNVLFDDETGVLKTECLEDTKGSVVVCNIDGTTVASSSELNNTFSLTQRGIYVVCLNGETWAGSGKFVY